MAYCYDLGKDELLLVLPGEQLGILINGQPISQDQKLRTGLVYFRTEDQPQTFGN